MKDFYVLGFMDNTNNALRRYGYLDGSYNYICSGIILMDLEKLRKFQAVQKFENFINLYRDYLYQQDHKVINAVLSGKIGFIPPEYDKLDFFSENRANKFLYFVQNENKYNKDDFIKAYREPKIFHFTSSKPYYYACQFRNSNIKININRNIIVIKWLFYLKKKENIFKCELDFTSALNLI